jgi:hypothetical protein
VAVGVLILLRVLPEHEVGLALWLPGELEPPHISHVHGTLQS